MKLSSTILSFSLAVWSVSANPSLDGAAGDADHQRSGLHPIPSRRYSESGLLAKKVKVRYGPYHTPPTKNGSYGMLAKLTPYIQKPCTNCLITAIWPSFETEDGKNANVDRGYMLHHSTLLNQGKGRADAACKYTWGDVFTGWKGQLPKGLNYIETQPVDVEVLFSTGNERTQMDFYPVKKAKAGYYVRPGDQFHAMTEIMNMTPQPVQLYVTFTYEYLEGTPAGWQHARPLWFDVANCTKSSVPAQLKDTYSLNSRTWIADFEGYIIGGSGHVHNGGTDVELYQNGKEICKSVSDYGGSPEFIQGSGPGKGAKFISRNSICVDVGNLKKGDQLHIDAHYNTKENMQMLNFDGKPEEVMGKLLVYVAMPLEGIKWI